MITERLKQLRIAEDWDQGDVARELGIPRSTYSGYENGSRKPSYNVVIQLAKFYNVSADYLLGLTNDPRALDEPEMDIKRVLELGEYTFKGKSISSKDIDVVISVLNNLIHSTEDPADAIKFKDEDRDKIEQHKGQ